MGKIRDFLLGKPPVQETPSPTPEAVTTDDEALVEWFTRHFGEQYPQYQDEATVSSITPQVTNVAAHEGATTMSSIRNTFSSLLSDAGLSSYESHAESVISGLEAREASIVDTLRAEGTAAGASAEAIEGILVTAGLVEPAPEPEVAVSNESGGSDLEALVNRLAHQVERLTEAAARAGVRV